ncbi:MAG: ATP-binding protein [Candidatus Omnitrophica bacterium]|nr:ATP-binding protein [Candidatus Omnitrophota bacterium]
MFIKEQFIGREDITKLINKRIYDLREGYRQNIALLGEELVGKTWIIKSIFDNFSDTKIIPLYIDLSQSNANIFIQRFLNTILFSFLKTKGITLSKENTNKLIDEAKAYIPNTAIKIQELNSIAKDKLDVAMFRDALSILETLNKETNQKIIIILDEFHNLESLKIRNLFQELGKKIMIQKDTMYIVLSSNKVRAKRIIQDELSLLFGNFETLEINNFDTKTSNILIKNRLKNIFLPKDITNFLINFTGGNPFYLDKITQQLYKNSSMLEENSGITPFVFIYTLEEILFNKWGSLNLKFQNHINILLSKNKQEMLDILLLIAQGKNRIKDLSSTLHRNYRDVNQKLSRLIETNIIYRTGSFYDINDRLFNFWLNFVYLERLNNLSQNYDDQVMSFRKKIEQSLSEFIENSRKDVSQRLQELFVLFSNDSIKLGRNKLLLLKFKEIKPLEFGGNFIKKGFFCNSEEEKWLIGLKEGDITESCVCEFIKESEKMHKKDKSLRRMIIGLDKTEINASLIAKEKKITTLDINHLNTLLDLYGKPRLIV